MQAPQGTRGTGMTGYISPVILSFNSQSTHSEKGNLSILLLTPGILGLKTANEWVKQGHHKTAKIMRAHSAACQRFTRIGV